WVLPKLARDGTFPLLDILEKLPPDAVLPDGMTAYKAAENQELDIGKIVHFALGIFWKASVHSWKRQKRMDDPMINLGVYGEGLRQFLKGEGTFPENIALLVRIGARKDVANFNGSAQPHRGRCKQAHNYSFCVPGAMFMLYAGKQIPRDIRVLCIQSSALHPILVDTISLHLLKIASGMGK